MLALKTLEAIETAMVKDQGAKYRSLLRPLMAKAEDAYNPNEELFRSHLGASLIGRECARELWYSFHWSFENKFSGRLLRLFNTGHLMEPRIVASLELIGVIVHQYDTSGKQFRISGYKGHFGGSLDAVSVGIPDLDPEIPVLSEFKSHSNKSFEKLQIEGVIKSKWEHFVQMQMYMGHYNLKYSIYIAQNKDTDDLHAEIIQFDPTQYKRYQDRSAMVIDSKTPPPKINESPGWYKCKFCSANSICHGGAAPVRNCRTCQFSSVEDNGVWNCNLNPNVPMALPKSLQLTGCFSYILNPVYKSK